MPKRTTKRRQAAMAAVAAPSTDPEPIAQLIRYLSAPRLRARGTISTYRGIGLRLLATVPGRLPNDNDVRDYFIRRRGAQISERTLRKEFYALQRLFAANSWEWKFTSHDAPFFEEHRLMPAMTEEEVRRMIGAWRSYTKAERFYLAISTMFGCRREALAEQEIAVAVHHRDGSAGGASAQRFDHARVERIGKVVVARPVFEQVTEDVEGFGVAGGPRE